MSAKKRPNTKKRPNKQQGMQKTMRFIGLVSAIALVLGLLAIASVLTANSIAAGPKPGFYEDGKKRVKDADPMLTVGGREISIMEYRYYYLTNKDTILSWYGEDYYLADPDGSREEELKTSTEELLRTIYAWLTYAQEEGIGLTADETAAIENEVTTAKAQMGDQFKIWLATNRYGDEETYILIRTTQEIQKKAQEALASQMETDHEEDWQEKVVSTQHILYKFEEGADDESKDATRAEAQEALERIQGARKPVDEFAKLLAEKQLTSEDDPNVPSDEYGYGGDTGQTLEGYTFGPDTMVEEFYKGALGVEIGEITEVIETTYGCHIILRLELDEEYMEENEETLKTAVMSRFASDYIEEKAAELAIVGGKYYADVKVDNIK